MPIRIVKDRDRSAQDNYPGEGGGGGGGRLPGGLNTGCLTALLPFILKNPKIAILILAVLAAVYFFGGGKNLLPSTSSSLSLGAALDERMYDKAEVYEPLADNIKNPLPERVTLEGYAPERLNQGQQGSCVAWASAYAARSILYAKEKGTDPQQSAFSPSFLYNQIGLEGCQGSYIIRAMETMKGVGAIPFNDFPYSDQDCSAQPNQYLLRKASDFKINGFNRLSKSGDDYKVDMLAIKQNLAQNAPVVIGMMVGGSFMQSMMGKQVWIPETSDYDMMGFGGHAMCVIGYDDYLEGGAFQIMNSWGNEWGENGLAWVRYKDFDTFVKEAYGLYPMGANINRDKGRLQAEFALVIYDDNTGKTTNLTSIPLHYKNGIIYATSQPLNIGTTFKIEVTNQTECYSYIFGQETDGSSYVLFPYTPKHSPYCGITGTRLFPKDYSLKPDETGNKDLMAVVVTKEPIDYNQLNAAISSSSRNTYAGKLMEALGDKLIRDVNFQNVSGNIAFDCSTTGGSAVAIVIEVDKK